MQYKDVHEGRFIRRLNRFVATVDLGGTETVCHVKNTGRCVELLVPGATVYLDRPGTPGRKTQYDLVTVQKGGLLINMDSQAPNKAFGEYLRTGGLFGPGAQIRPEFTHGSSRFDFFVNCGRRRALIEVKGVTLEKEGLALFPDAPTERGVKHLLGLMEAVDQGYECCVAFVIQMKGVTGFSPNRATHPRFAQVLEQARGKGVALWAADCAVTPDSMKICDEVRVIL